MMQLNPQQQQEMMTKLNASWRVKVCGICGASNWAISDRVWQLSEFENGNLVVGGPVQPLITVACNTCGNTHIFNAMKIVGNFGSGANP